jgi:prepilin-type N-terminal cleavage/methylation domain-containing protein
MKNQKGFSLIEVLVSLAIVGILSVSFLGAMTNSTKAAISVDQKDTGRAIAQSQMEYVKELKFSASGYTKNSLMLAQYPNYDVSISVSTPGDPGQRDALIQKVTIVVTNNGKEVFTLEDYKTKR